MLSTIKSCLLLTRHRLQNGNGHYGNGFFRVWLWCYFCSYVFHGLNWWESVLFCTRLVNKASSSRPLQIFPSRINSGFPVGIHSLGMSRDPGPGIVEEFVWRGALGKPDRSGCLLHDHAIPHYKNKYRFTFGNNIYLIGAR